MWIPQIIVCIATACRLLPAEPVDTEAACRAYIERVMVPLVVTTLPGARIAGARCHREDTPT